MNRTSLSLLLTFVNLTIGYAVIHGTVMVFLGSAIQQIWPVSRGGAGDHLEITEEGEALLQPFANGRWLQIYRRLDGTEISEPLGLGLKFAKRTYMPGLSEREPHSWQGRLESFQDFRKPATFWYLIAPPNRQDTAYFAAYDATSRQSTGYLGINGFSVEMPSAEQSFRITPSNVSAFSSCVASTQEGSRFLHVTEPNSAWWNQDYTPVLNATPDTVWILSHGTIYEIHLAGHTVTTLLTDRTDLLSISQLNSTRDGKTSLQLVGVTEAGLVAIDPETKQSNVIQLDRDPRQSSDQIYQLKNGRWVVVVRNQSSDPDEPNKETIFWLDDNYQVDRQAERTYPKFRQAESALMMIGLSIGFPTPLVPLGIGHLQAFFTPRSLASRHSYFESLMKSYSFAKIWLVITSVISVATGWACRRREREVFGNASWFWPILVGVCGWFGWMGYICLRPLPARLPNRQWLPSQPEPVRPLGTEIFA